MAQYTNLGKVMELKNHFKNGTILKDLMNRKIFKVVILFIGLIAYNFSLNAQTWPPAGMVGNGASSSPWEIATAEHLKALADYVNAGNGNNTNDKHYKLTNDVDLNGYASGEGWKPIGENSTNKSFQGYFQGNYKVVKNLTINRLSNYTGLFGYVSSGYIINLGVENCNIVGQDNVGGLAGEYKTGNYIANCHVTGSIRGRDRVGGLVGLHSSAGIEPFSNCYTTCNVSGNNGVGGLVGSKGNIGNPMSKCYAKGNISGGNYVGGLVGSSYYSSISNCYASGNVSGTGSRIGGLAGQNNTVISQCYATGNVNGDVEYVGGLVGFNDGDISYCYAAGSVNGNSHVGGLVGINGTTVNTATVRNCVAANAGVASTATTTFIDRIVGSNSGKGVCISNYALNAMTVQNSNGNVTVTEGSAEAGAGKEATILKSLAFYTTTGNWDTETWEITSSTSIWKICDAKTLPWLRWQDINCNDVGISETVLSNIKIYPNPINDKFVVEIDEVVSVKLYDILGNEVLNKNATGTIEINISHLPRGIYNVQIISGGNVVRSSKIVKR